MCLRLLYARLEKIIRDLVASGAFQRVEEILEQLCNDYAYAVHQPHARNGGLIGLAAAAIALGTVCSTFCIARLPTPQAIYKRHLLLSRLACCTMFPLCHTPLNHIPLAHCKGFYARSCHH